MLLLISLSFIPRLLHHAGEFFVSFVSIIYTARLPSVLERMLGSPEKGLPRNVPRVTVSQIGPRPIMGCFHKLSRREGLLSQELIMLLRSFGLGEMVSFFFSLEIMDGSKATVSLCVFLKKFRV